MFRFWHETCIQTFRNFSKRLQGIKMIKKRFCAVAFALLSAASLHAGAAPVEGVTFTGGSVFSADGPWTLGYRFTADQALKVTALGAYDYLGDGFSVTHEVGLWNSFGDLLASAVVDNNDPLTGMFRYQTISAITLVAGQSYFVGASNFGSDRDPYALDATITSAPGITYTDATYMEGSGLQVPGRRGTPGGYFGGNFLFSDDITGVPEPMSLSLFAIGVMGLAAMRRKQVSK